MSNYNVYFFLKALLVFMVVACPLVKTPCNHLSLTMHSSPCPTTTNQIPGLIDFIASVPWISFPVSFHSYKLSLDFITFNLIQVNVLKQHNIVVKEHGLRSLTMWVHIWLYLIHY